MKIKKGDKVKILVGKDKGKTGSVLVAIPKYEKILIDGINMKKRHQRPRKQGEKGKIVEVATPVHISNVRKV